MQSRCEELREVALNFMDEPVHIWYESRTELTLEGVRKYYVDVEKDEYKLLCLGDLYECMRITQVILTVNRLHILTV